MKTICPYCWYQKPDRPLSDPILRVISEPDLPLEDYMLWVERQVKMFDLRDWHGVQVHIGRMHKGMPVQPMHELNPHEAAIINRTDKNKAITWL